VRRNAGHNACGRIEATVVAEPLERERRPTTTGELVFVAAAARHERGRPDDAVQRW
jgi:hypothetical protein